MGVSAPVDGPRVAHASLAFCCSYMDGGRIAFSGTPEQMRGYLRQLGAVV